MVTDKTVSALFPTHFPKFVYADAALVKEYITFFEILNLN